MPFVLPAVSFLQLSYEKSVFVVDRNVFPVRKTKKRASLILSPVLMPLAYSIRSIPPPPPPSAPRPPSPPPLSTHTTSDDGATSKRGRVVGRLCRLRRPCSHAAAQESPRRGVPGAQSGSLETVAGPLRERRRHQRHCCPLVAIIAGRLLLQAHTSKADEMQRMGVGEGEGGSFAPAARTLEGQECSLCE